MNLKTSRRTSFGITAAIVILGAGAGGAAIAASSDDAHNEPLAALAGRAPATPLVTSVAADQASAISALRMPVSDQDAVPSPIATKMEQGMVGKVFGANPALARRLHVDAGAAWVIPGDGQVCLMVNTTPTADHPKTLDSSMAGCGSLEKLAEGQLYLTSTDNTVDPSAEYAAGLVPDGVGSVTLTLSDGTAKTVETPDNAYAYASSGVKAVRVSFTTADGRAVTVNL